MIDGTIQVRSLTKCQEFQLARILCRPGPRILLSRFDLVYFYPGWTSPIQSSILEIYPIFRHLYFVDFASYGCPVININQVVAVAFLRCSMLSGARPRGKICFSVSLSPTKAGSKEARRGAKADDNS